VPLIKSGHAVDGSAPLKLTPGGISTCQRFISARHCPIGFEPALNRGIPAAWVLAFTVAPHLQLINYRGCFCGFGGI